MTSQFGHSDFILASNRGLSCASYRAVFVSGSSRATLAAFVPPSELDLVLEPLLESSSLPQAASASAPTAAMAAKVTRPCIPLMELLLLPAGSRDSFCGGGGRS